MAYGRGGASMNCPAGSHSPYRKIGHALISTLAALITRRVDVALSLSFLDLKICSCGCTCGYQPPNSQLQVIDIKLTRAREGDERRTVRVRMRSTGTARDIDFDRSNRIWQNSRGNSSQMV